MRNIVKLTLALSSCGLIVVDYVSCVNILLKLKLKILYRNTVLVKAVPNLYTLG